MSVRLMNRVFDLVLPPMQKLVLLTMSSHADDDGGSCYPSVERIAARTGLTRRGTQKILRRLEDSRLLVPMASQPGSSRNYHIRIPQGGEQGSQGERTRFTGGANQRAERGERGSPDSSLSVTEPSSKQNLPPQKAARGLPAGRATTTKDAKQPPKKQDSGDGHDIETRHVPIREEIKRSWRLANPGTPAAPWNGRDGAALKKLLSANPEWSVEQFTRCVANRFRSNVNHADLPAEWIPKLISYASSPLDQYKRPIGRETKENAGGVSLQRPKPTLKLDVPPGLDQKAGAELWEAMKDEFRRDLPPHRFDALLLPTHGLGVGDGVLFVKAPHETLIPEIRKLLDSSNALATACRGLKIELRALKEVPDVNPRAS